MLAAIIINNISAVAWWWGVEALAVQGEDRRDLGLSEHYDYLGRWVRVKWDVV